MRDPTDEELAERAASAMLRFTQWFQARMREKHRDRNGDGARHAEQRRNPTSASTIYRRAKRGKPL